MKVVSDASPIASRLGIAVRGVLGVLLAAKRQGTIPMLAAEIRRLRQEAHFFIAAPLEAQVLLAAGESIGP